MSGAPPKELYSRKQVERVLGISERQLRSWEKLELVPRLEEFTLRDLVALKSLQKLRENRVATVRIRRAVRALRDKLQGVENPLRDLKIVCEGRKIAVHVEGQKMEPVSGQLLLDFDGAELKSLLSFPPERNRGRGSAGRQREAEVWFEKGLELEQVGAPLAEIVEAYQRALELDPRSTGALVNLGTIHYHLHAFTEAERCYKTALEADPGYALAHFNLGNLFDERGDRAAAMEHYQAALRINPNYGDAHYNLALLHQTQGETLKAVRHWKLYLKLDPTSTWANIARRELEKLCRSTVLPGAKGNEAGEAT